MFRTCLVAAIAVAGTSIALAADAPPSRVTDGGVVHVPAFDLPFSSLASPEARDAFVRSARTPPPTFRMPPDATVQQERAAMDAFFAPVIAAVHARYPVKMTEETIAGVRTQVFVPTDGIAPENARRVLINLHGGGFYMGSGTISQIESVPLASIARIRVVSIDYRLAPEHRFPAASEDVATVYRALLTTHRPADIAIYGCSAGGRLAGQSMAWFHKVGLPAPASVGIFCSSTTVARTGDTTVTTPRFGGMMPTTPPRWLAAYTEGQDPANPLIAASTSPEVLAAFPPTLLITGSRSAEMSAAARTAIDLSNAGVDARLFVWDGMDHGFFYNPDLPESREAYAVMARFFREQFERAAHSNPHMMETSADGQAQN